MLGIWVSLSLTLSRNEKIEHRIRKKAHKLIPIRLYRLGSSLIRTKSLGWIPLEDPIVVSKAMIQLGVQLKRVNMIFVWKSSWQSFRQICPIFFEWRYKERSLVRSSWLEMLSLEGDVPMSKGLILEEKFDRNLSLSLSLTLSKNDKVKHHKRKKTHS